jgi:hypothetical protein
MTLSENSERKFRSPVPVRHCAQGGGDDNCRVAKWHSKFHAAVRGIEATPLKKWEIR